MLNILFAKLQLSQINKIIIDKVDMNLEFIHRMKDVLIYSAWF